MKVKLRALQGDDAGKEFRIPTSVCLIGRSKECHLRPRSEAVSRRHCEILVEGENVIVRDLGSKNGTFINGERIQTEDVAVLRTGDKLRIGPLRFEVVIDSGVPGEKKPAELRYAKDVPNRITSHGQIAPGIDQSDVGSWLDEADRMERERQLRDPETCQLTLEETDQVLQKKPIEETAKEETPQHAPTPEKGRGRREFGKLPRKTATAKDSGEAAAEVLREFFKNR
jgi:pSer/pThr/pTyr-binding forkhead associated (FHA) protein